MLLSLLWRLRQEDSLSNRAKPCLHFFPLLEYRMSLACYLNVASVAAISISCQGPVCIDCRPRGLAGSTGSHDTELPAAFALCSAAK